MQRSSSSGTENSNAGGFGRHHKNKFRSATDASNSNTKQRHHNNNKRAALEKSKEKYVVIITNVENDFARVHEDNLPMYCCLNPKRNVKHGARVEGEECVYDIKCRSETRSAEIKVIGKADATLSTIFAPVRTGGDPREHGGDGDENGCNNDDGVSVAADPTAVPQAELVLKEDVRGGAHARAAPGVFTTLQDMVMVLQNKPYFTHPPKFAVSLPGKEAGEALPTTLKLKARKEKKKAAAASTSEAAQEKASVKRPRESSDSDVEDGDIEDSSSSSTSKARKVARTEEEADVDSTAPVVTATSSSLVLKQYSGNQTDLVTAVAAVSTHWGTKELRKRLGDLPGFLSCWPLYSKHFRVVFENSEVLFKAKQLLDQFELDGSVRVSMTLSDALARKYADFTAANDDDDVLTVTE